MRIGVTGGTGFIGQYFLREYAGEHQFAVITSRDDMTGLYQHPCVNYVRKSYDKQGFESVFSDCEGIVHLGAKRSTKEREESIMNYSENLRVAEALFDACTDLGIRNIINISSTAVYDTTLPYPFREVEATAPLSNYGIVKHAIEGIAHLYNMKKDTNIKSLRVAQVLGVGERAGYMLSVFQDRCLKQQKLSVYGTGSAGREYIYVKDVAYAIMCALNSEHESGIYNIGMGSLTTNLELARCFCKVFENLAGYEQLLDKPESTECFLMDGALAEEKLGFHARYTLSEALSDMKRILENED